MKIDEIFMKNEMQVEVNRIKKCSCVDIGFNLMTLRPYLVFFRFCLS